MPQHLGFNNSSGSWVENNNDQDYARGADQPIITHDFDFLNSKREDHNHNFEWQNAEVFKVELIKLPLIS